MSSNGHLTTQKTDAEFDLGFSPSLWCQRMKRKSEWSRDYVLDDFFTRSKEASDRALSGTGYETLQNQAYGTSDSEIMDLFLPHGVKKDAPILIFIHGGDWQIEVCNKSVYLVVAPPIVKQGAIVAVVEYTIAPKASVAQMVEQVRNAIVFLAKKYPETRGIYLSGHCCGGHLSAMMLSVDWTEHLGDERSYIKGICPISGVMDLRPISKSYINEPLCLTESSACAVSPMVLVDSIPERNLSIPVRLVIAEFDTPIFIQQTRDYGKLLVERGMDAKVVEVPDSDHFDSIIDLEKEDFIIQEVLREMMNL